MRIPLLVIAGVLVLSGCGGESEAADTDGTCAAQAADLADVRALTEELSQPDSHWGPGGPGAAADTAGDAVTALTGYTPSDDLARVVDRATDAVQAFHDDLADDDTLEGDGQSASTAGAALAALEDACA